MSTPSPISAAFAARNSQGQLAFIPFVTAGDPNLEVTGRLVRELAAAGADLIEIGFPYSDPIADGPVIQASYTRALGQRLKLEPLFAAAKTWSASVQVPLVAMVSYAIISRTGREAFLDKAKDAGFRGFIVPDLPGDEADEFAALVRSYELDLIQLVAPTTPATRLSRILKNATGFVYCIAVAGTTGVREALVESLHEMLARLKEATTLPLAVGFGIGKPAQVQELRGKAEGAIVGSAIVRYLETITDDPKSVDDAIAQVGVFARSMAARAHGES